MDWNAIWQDVISSTISGVLVIIHHFTTFS